MDICFVPRRDPLIIAKWWHSSSKCHMETTFSRRGCLFLHFPVSKKEDIFQKAPRRLLARNGIILEHIYSHGRGWGPPLLKPVARKRDSNEANQDSLERRRRERTEGGVVPSGVCCVSCPNCRCSV